MTVRATTKADEEADTVVEVENLTKVFDNRLKAVDDVSFRVQEGEIFGFLGPNGAGKSTTIKMLTTLIKPSSGKAAIFGHDVMHDPVHVRRIVGVVPQEYTADEDMTGYENIVLTADLYGIPRAVSKDRALELLELVELKDAAGRKVSTYSGGMRRRLELATGLINHPRLLFLDEPTLGLDVQTRSAVWAYIKKMKDEYHMTLFLTTHYLEEADWLCDRIAIIDHGKIVKVGAPGELKSSLGGDIIGLGIRETGVDLTETISRVGQVKEVKRVDSEYRIKAVDGEEVAPEIMDVIREKGYHVTKISVTKPTLDEVYLEYTGRSLREEGGDRNQMWSQRRTMRMSRR